MSRPNIPSGYWKQIEGILESETDFSEEDGIEQRGRKLLEVVREGVNHL